MSRQQIVWLLIPVALCLTPEQANGQIRTNPGFATKTLAANDDGSAPLEPLGWTLNFFGRQRNALYVNNNGNVTFDSALPDYTPFGLEGVSREIIAAFFADVDTRNRASRLVTYGSDTIGGRPAFGVNYLDVGYFDTKADKTNSFQLVLIQREDTGNGNFDIEFNYERITWETGDASGGVGGLGGVSASVGWSNGSGLPGTSYQLPGSLIPGSFLDFGPFSLSRGRTVGTNSQQGRFAFRGRGGQIVQNLNILTGCPVPNGSVGKAYSFRFEASGSRPPYRWSVTPDPDTTLPLTMSTSGVLTGVPTRAGEFSFTVRAAATDEDGEVSVTRRCSLTVDPPVVSFRSGTTLPRGIAGSRYETRLLADGAGTTLRFDPVSAEIPGLTLSPSGVLSGTLPAAGTYAFQARARGEATAVTVPAIKRFTVTVNPAELTVRASCPLPNATGGVPYTYRFEVRGGEAPYRWRAIGTLPPGISLTTDGLLQGQPTVPHWWPFDVRVEDSRGRSVETGCGLLVVFPEMRIGSGGSCVLPQGQAGAPYTHRLTAAGGVGPYSWSLAGGALPPGLRLASDGAVSGTPLGAMLSQFRIQVRDSRGQQTATGCSVTVNRGEYSIASCPLPSAYAGEPYSYRMNATGGAEPYRFAEAQPLPAGLRLSPDGFLAGTLTTPGTYPVSVRVADAAGRTTVRTCDVRVLPQALRLTTACPLPSASVGEAYNTRLTAGGGVEPVQFTARGLPAGLRLNPNGELTGTPSQAGWFPLEVTVNDRAGNRVAQFCEVGVGMPELPELKITGMPATLAPATAGPSVAVELASAYPVDVEGELTLEVTAETGNGATEINQPDALVRFNGNQSRVPFVIRAGTTRSTPAVQVRTTGTVASALKVKASSIQVGGTDLLRQAEATGRVPRLAPVLTNVCFVPGTNSFDVEVSGYTTTRDMVSAELTFGANRYLVDLLGPSRDFFADADTARTGGTFRIRAPYRLSQGTAQSLGQGTAVIRNSAGASASRAIARCQ